MRQHQMQVTQMQIEARGGPVGDSTRPLPGIPFTAGTTADMKMDTSCESIGCQCVRSHRPATQAAG